MSSVLRPQNCRIGYPSLTYVDAEQVVAGFGPGSEGRAGNSFRPVVNVHRLAGASSGQKRGIEGFAAFRGDPVPCSIQVTDQVHAMTVVDHDVAIAGA